jgi:hypothetical protein
MKKIYCLLHLLLFSIALNAQVPAADTIVPAKGNVKEQLKDIKKEKVDLHSDSTGNEPVKTPLVDTTKHNKYDDLLNDDPKFNKKYPIWIPALQVFGENLLLNLLDRSGFASEFAKVDMNSWKRTVNAGFPGDRAGNGSGQICNVPIHPMMQLLL